MFRNWDSIKDDTGKRSSRKLTAFAITICIVLCNLVWLIYAYKQKDFSLLIALISADISFVLALLGMTSYSKNKTNGRDNKE